MVLSDDLRLSLLRRGPLPAVEILVNGLSNQTGTALCAGAINTRQRILVNSYCNSLHIGTISFEPLGADQRIGNAGLQFVEPTPG